MVLGSQGPGRVGRRRFNFTSRPFGGGSSSLWGSLAVRRPRAPRRLRAGGPQRRHADLWPRLRRTGPARPEGGSQRLTVRMSSRLAEGPGRLEVVLPDRILEQYESAGDVSGTPEAIAP
jgi:hypothetical protein